MDIYGEIILDHFKNPRNYGLLKDATLESEDLNPLCGDQIKISLRLDDINKIVAFGFEGNGCAVSIASMSLLGEKLLGMKMKEVMALEQADILELLDIPISGGRINCAMLGGSTVKKALINYSHLHKK